MYYTMTIQFAAIRPDSKGGKIKQNKVMIVKFGAIAMKYYKRNTPTTTRSR